MVPGNPNKGRTARLPASLAGHDDLVWMTRHHELFSPEFWKKDAKY